MSRSFLQKSSQNIYQNRRVNASSWRLSVQAFCLSVLLFVIWSFVVLLVADMLYRLGWQIEGAAATIGLLLWLMGSIYGVYFSYPRIKAQVLERR